ncbi:unnamed protein product [Pieris brassicae]|uniref:Uncharacterized protein n=1 Tax=Pieris brassicae TaxID=7116 RepID=A0A9P0X4K0_PIEBR|nr:unnamed protein product [Pieris brassicae]
MADERLSWVGREGVRGRGGSGHYRAVTSARAPRRAEDEPLARRGCTPRTPTLILPSTLSPDNEHGTCSVLC